MTIQEIKDSVTESDAYRREAEIKRRIAEWAASKLPAVQDGYERTITGVDYEVGVATYTDTLIADRLAAEAAQAAEAARLATLPAQFGSGVAVLDANGHWLELVPIGDDVIPVQVSNSPLDPDTRDTMRAAGVLEWNQHRQRIAAIENDLLTIDTAVDEMMAVDLSATGAVGVAIAATTGVNKTALTAMRNALIDVRAKAKKGLNNSRQACEKLRKEVK